MKSVASEIIQEVFKNYEGKAAIALKGEVVVGEQNSACIMDILHEGVIRDMALKSSLIELAKAHMKGYVEIKGDIHTLFEFTDYLIIHDIPLTTKMKLLPKVMLLEKLEIKAEGSGVSKNSKESISYHYDVSNQFYKLFLDENMVYSCGYFKKEDNSLDLAQKDKLDHICKKLHLKKDETLLDIGCGWGSMLIWAAQYYGIKGHGITLSENQLEVAKERAKEHGLEDRVTFELRDYRDLDDSIKYDKIVSIGMFEHIGIKNYPIYFGKVKELLKNQGIFLNHGITTTSEWGVSEASRFINKYIFPDGELAKISQVLSSMEDLDWEIEDVESLRRHYALTLKAWVDNLEKNREKAVESTNFESYALWRIYMAGSAHYFRTGDIGIYQIVASKRGENLRLPLTREHIYK
ncbi:MAG: class I SAM-dependent methyltransferase [Campylobacterales bacterium]